jgi:hypothetical protein
MMAWNEPGLAAEPSADWLAAQAETQAMAEAAIADIQTLLRADLTISNAPFSFPNADRTAITDNSTTINVCL